MKIVAINLDKFHQQLEEFVFNNQVHKDDIDYVISKTSSSIDNLNNLLSLNVSKPNQLLEVKEKEQTQEKSVEKNSVCNLNAFSEESYTLNELYHQRAVLTSLFVNENPNICWKSLRHHKADTPIYDGMFVVGIETPFGIATFHYSVDKYWDLFCVQELPCAPKWDGHSPEESIERLKLFSESIGM